MKERPILFSAPMVRALLAGTKTQTRRICRAAVDEAGEELRDLDGWPLRDCSIDGAGEVRVACRYGVPGDRLWVRETHAPQADCWGAWQRRMTGDKLGPDPVVHYSADYDLRNRPFVDKWRPAIHMPRWASRITLEVTGVRVERVEEITDQDARDEGFAGTCPAEPHRGTVCGTVGSRDAFLHLFYEINARAPRGSNPWVWVIEFRRTK